MRDQIDNIGQYTRRDNVKVMGIPKTDNENLPKILCDVVKHNGVDMSEDNISTIHRFNTKEDKVDPNATNSRGGNKKIPSFIARLTHRTIKQEIIGTKRQIKEKNGAPYPDAFIVEDLTPLRSRILHSMRNRLDRNGEKVYKFVWSKEGRLFCRTEEESKQRDSNGQIKQARPHVVDKVDDLLDLGWTQNEVNDIRYNRTF